MTHTSEQGGQPVTLPTYRVDYWRLVRQYPDYPAYHMRSTVFVQAASQALALRDGVREAWRDRSWDGLAVDCERVSGWVANTPCNSSTPVHGEVYEADTAAQAYELAAQSLIPWLEEQLECGGYDWLSMDCDLTIADDNTFSEVVESGSVTAYLGVYCDRCDTFEYPGRDGWHGGCDKWDERCQHDHPDKWQDDCTCRHCADERKVAA